MTFPPSTVLAFTAALKSGLEQRSALENTLVTDGPATTMDLESLPEIIELLDVEGEQLPHALDRTTQPRAEQMTITVRINVLRPGRDVQTDTNTRAFEILDELNQLLRDRESSAGVAAIYAGPGRIYGPRITKFKHTKRTDKDETVREAALELGVYWEGRI